MITADRIACLRDICLHVPSVVSCKLELAIWRKILTQDIDIRRLVGACNFDEISVRLRGGEHLHRGENLVVFPGIVTLGSGLYRRGHLVEELLALMLVDHQCHISDLLVALLLLGCLTLIFPHFNKCIKSIV